MSNNSCKLAATIGQTPILKLLIMLKPVNRGVVFKVSFAFLIILAFSSCKTNTDEDPETVARNFCECMKKNNAPKDYLYALTVCDGRFVKESRFYRIYRVDIRFGEPDRKVSRASEDSAYQFIKVFHEYTEKKCCDLTLECADDSVKK